MPPPATVAAIDSTPAAAISGSALDPTCSDDGASCPTITSLQLPLPCPGLDYSVELTVSPGRASDYTWSLESPALSDLSLSSAGRISGVPVGGGRMRVVAKNAKGQLARAQLDLTPRQSCWLAYLDAGAGDARLHFRDVFASTRDLELPDVAAPGERALDFAFSPDGRWLAFRAAVGDAITLHLLPIASEPQGLEQQISARALDLRCGSAGATCSVLDFAWSKDSQRLAVALHDAGDGSDHLSGVDVAAPEAVWASAGTDLTFGMPLRYVGGLLWFGERGVAFVGQNPLSPEENALYHATLAATARSFDELTLHVTVSGSSLILRDAPPGLLVLNPESDARYVDVTHANAVTYHAGAWFSPSGQFFAKTTSSARLELYAATDALTPIAALDGEACGAVIAWSVRNGDRESIACSAARSTPDGSLEPTGDDLMLVDLVVTPAPRFAAPFRVLPSATYDPTAVAGARRIFSESATWLVVASPAYDALVIDRSQPAPRPDFLGIPIAPTAEAAISPKGNSLLVYDDSVTLYSLARSPARSLSFLDDGSPVPTPVDRFACQESAQLAPDRWCGSAHPPAHFKWAPDSESLLYEDAASGLWLAQAKASADTAPIQLAAGMPRPAPGQASRAYAFKP